MDKCKKSFKTYFTCLSDHVKKWNSLVSSSDKPMSVLSNLTEHLQIILSVDLNSEIALLFPDVKDRIAAKLQLLLEDEISQLLKIQESMNYNNKDLKMRLSQLEQAYQQHSTYVKQSEHSTEKNCHSGLEDSSQEFDPLWLPFNELLEMAADAWRYYHDAWLNINVCLMCVDFEEPNSVTNLKNAFNEDDKKKQHISRMLLITKYLVEQE